MNARRKRYQSLLEPGLVLHSDFSGQLSAETAVKMMVKASKDAGMEVCSETEVLLWSASDGGSLQQPIAKSAKAKVCHVFSDVLDCYPEDVYERIVSLRPDKLKKTSATQVEKQAAVRAYELQLSHLQRYMDNPRRGQTVASRQGCLLHPDEVGCPIEFPRAVHDQRLSWHWAGPPCIAWSSQGSHLGAADPATECFQAYAVKMNDSSHDLVTMENVTNMPVQNFRQFMHRMKWQMVSVTISLRSSWGVSRYRRYQTAVNLETLVWLGPSRESEQQTLFDELFFTDEERITADDFLVCGEAAVTEVMRSMAADRGNHCRDDTQPPLSRCIATGCLERLQSYSKQFDAVTKARCRS